MLRRKTGAHTPASPNGQWTTTPEFFEISRTEAGADTNVRASSMTPRGRARASRLPWPQLRLGGRGQTLTDPYVLASSVLH